MVFRGVNLSSLLIYFTTILLSPDYVASKDGMTGELQFRKVCKKARGNEENTKDLSRSR